MSADYPHNQGEKKKIRSFYRMIVNWNDTNLCTLACTPRRLYKVAQKLPDTLTPSHKHRTKIANTQQKHWIQIFVYIDFVCLFAVIIYMERKSRHYIWIRYVCTKIHSILDENK